MILSFLEEILCHEKVRNKVWPLGPVQNQSTNNDKRDIKANMDKIFID